MTFSSPQLLNLTPLTCEAHLAFGEASGADALRRFGDTRPFLAASGMGMGLPCSS